MGVRLPRRVIRKYTLARRLPVKLADIATDLDAIIYVRDALIAQGCQSSTEDGMCMYREGRLACAAGQLISDEHYTEDFENVTVATHDGIDDYDLTATTAVGLARGRTTSLRSSTSCSAGSTPPAGGARTARHVPP
jgi:hypothetical protein